MARRRRVLGDDHPDTLTSANNLTIAFAALGEHQAACALAEDTLARRRRVLGDDHPDTLTSANTLAVRLAALGEHQAARALFEDTLARQQRLLGYDHPDTLTSANNLAAALHALEKHQAAKALSEDVVTRRRLLDDNYPDTLLSDLANLRDLEARSMVDEGVLREMKRRVLEARFGGDSLTGTKRLTARRWDVALSYSHDQQQYVERVAAALRARGMRVFFDRAEATIELWGRHLTEELPDIFAEETTAVVVFVSSEYASQGWPRLERRAALERTAHEHPELVLAARLDDTVLPGDLGGLGTVDLRELAPERFAEMVVTKLAQLGILMKPTDGAETKDR